MNWDAVSAIAQLVGTVAVVVTLIYLAIQVRYAKHQVWIQGMHSRGSTAVDLLAPLANDAKLAELLLKIGHPRYGDFGLEAVEAQRIGAWLHMWFQVQQANHYLLPERTHDELLQFALSTPGFAEFWEKNKGAYDAEFVDRLDRLKPGLETVELDPDDLFGQFGKKGQSPPDPTSGA